ncbi:FbpB family small basic protein [Bacillus sp. Marseille-P3661]|nr:FbpB family small basic protein [Bacillus sp. Marseille-P3661]
MRKFKGRSFKDLVSENKRELLNDREALNKIEERLEKRAQARLM